MIQLGSLRLKSNLFLSPLAGYTNLPFRRVVREIGGVDLCTTDLVNARSLLERNPKALKLIESSPDDRPLSIQLFGANPAEMRDAARICEDAGAMTVDINMGCPVKKVCKVGGGSAMMTELGKTQELVHTMIQAVRIPVTAKMRLGWDDENITAPELAKALEEAGIAAVFVHGRTRAQGFSGVVSLNGIRKVVQAVRSIPVIGNGDVTTPAAAAQMLAITGCAGVSAGRGAFYDPWLFKRTQHYLVSGELQPEPSFEDRIQILRRHLELMVEVFGEALGCVMFRKVAPWYAKRFGPASEFNKKVVLMSSVAQFEAILRDYQQWRRQFCDDSGELLPRYRLAPMAQTCGEGSDSGPKSALREAIPVPRAPVEGW